MACRKVLIRGHYRCRCGKKFAKSSRCGIKTGSRRKCKHGKTKAGKCRKKRR